jgi:predicted ABC-type sugar transport system permease subunit
MRWFGFIGGGISLSLGLCSLYFFIYAISIGDREGVSALGLPMGLLIGMGIALIYIGIAETHNQGRY